MNNITTTATSLMHYTNIYGPVPTWTTVIFYVCLAWVYFVGVPGNLIVTIVYGRIRTKNGCDWFILSIGFADTVVCLVTPALYIRTEVPVHIPYIFNWVCGMEVSITLSAMFASCALLTIVAVDRYIRMCLPKWSSITAPTAKILCIAMILISISISIPLANGMNSTYDRVCRRMYGVSSLTSFLKIYFTTMFAFYCLCFGIVTYAYGCVCWKIAKKVKNMQKILSNSGLQKPDFSEVSMEQTSSISGTISCITRLRKKSRNKADGVNSNKAKAINLQNGFDGSNDTKDGCGSLEHQQLQADDKGDNVVLISVRRPTLDSGSPDKSGNFHFTFCGGDEEDMPNKISDANSSERCQDFQRSENATDSRDHSKPYSESSDQNSKDAKSPPDVIDHVIDHDNTNEHDRTFLDETSICTVTPERLLSTNVETIKESDSSDNTFNARGQCQGHSDNTASQNTDRGCSDGDGKDHSRKTNEKVPELYINTQQQQPPIEVQESLLQPQDSLAVPDTPRLTRFQSLKVHLQRSRNGSKSSANGSSKKRKASNWRHRFKRERQITMMLLMVNVTFLVFWIPPLVLMLCIVHDINLFGDNVILMRVSYRYIDRMHLFKFMVNPILYWRFNPSFRERVKALFASCRCFCCKRTQQSATDV